MTQRETDRREWEDPANWSGGLVGLYFSKRDSRLWVPKRKPTWGWTLNLAHPRAGWWLAGLLALPAVLAGLRGRRR